MREDTHPLFGRTFRVLRRSVHRGGSFPVSYEVEYREGASLLVPVAATEVQIQAGNRTKLSVEALHDLISVVSNSNTMPIDPKDFWATLPTALQRRSSARSPQFWRRRIMKSELVKPTHLARRVDDPSGCKQSGELAAAVCASPASPRTWLARSRYRRGDVSGAERPTDSLRQYGTGYPAVRGQTVARRMGSDPRR